MLGERVYQQSNYIHPSVSFRCSTNLGKGLVIDANVVIGSPGFGFKKNAQDTGYAIPLERREHPYKVIIHDNVEIGANSIIHTGRWRDTEIGEGTKIDSLVHVAHNVSIGEHCLIVAGSVIGGSVTIGDNCFIGENVSIKQGITIARNVTIGMGSVVRHNIYEPNSTWAGNPCVKIADVQKF
jgi:UDP-3-O-[3-hydroxymyristoyl] glucosamine N-acyltransferase